jgi:hypothetical protein
MRSTLVKLVLGCGLAVALATPTLACEFYRHSVQTDQTVAEQQAPDPAATSTTDAPQTAESQPTASTGSN